MDFSLLNWCSLVLDNSQVDLNLTFILFIMQIISNSNHDVLLLFMFVIFVLFYSLFYCGYICNIWEANIKTHLMKACYAWLHKVWDSELIVASVKCVLMCLTFHYSSLTWLH